MNRLKLGDIVENCGKRSIVRWMGSVEDIPLIGLESIDTTLPGYTNGTCSLDLHRYFSCPDGRGFYINRDNFDGYYTVVQRRDQPERYLSHEDEFKSAEHSLSDSPDNRSKNSSYFPPSAYSDPNRSTSQSRGIMTRLNSDREQNRLGSFPSQTHYERPVSQSSSIESDPSSRIYRAETYRSTFNDYHEDLNPHRNINRESPSEENPNSSSSSSLDPLISLGQQYFLDRWSFEQVKSLIANEIPLDNQFCLHAQNDRSTVQSLVDQQINASASFIPALPPVDVRIELIKLFHHVHFIFPSRTIRLHEKDYLLLAILGSNNQCAYIRTTKGWAYTDPDRNDGSALLIEDITQMIDDYQNELHYQSEQCRHVLQNATFFYYKLVE